MARLGGMSAESFSSARERLSSASSGIGSLLRDQKAATTSANRMHVLLGLSSPLTGAAGGSHTLHSLSSSSVMEINGFLNLDDTEIKDEELWGLDMNEGGRSHPSDPLRRHLLLHEYELGSPLTQNYSFSCRGNGTHSLKHNIGAKHVDAPTKQESSFLVSGMHSAYHLAVDEQTEIPLLSSDAVSRNSRSTHSPPAIKLSEPRQVAHQGFVCLQPVPRADKRLLQDSYLHIQHQSGPLSVPNWSKSLCKETVSDSSDSDKVGAEDDEERLPPHEILAREYAQKERIAFSVCEGQGRTLKGRDMRRVRNAVWRQIGFAD